VEAFLREIPFAGRRPVYLGDDRTDEDAFRVVRAAGGVSVVVGTPESTAATSRLADVAAVHRWLDALATTLQRDA
jgi:trehalose 6-phosphate phosphatase